MKQKFYSNGKLLITGEYVVLDGATAFAIPTSFGQDLIVTPIPFSEIRWESRDEKGKTWFSDVFCLKTLQSKKEKLNPVSDILTNILIEARKLNPTFLAGESGFEISTQLDFPRDWGLGSSSTLINNISQWADINPFELLKKSFSGSGYDIAAAQNNQPILYKKSDDTIEITPISMQWDFTDKLFFVHLNKKQNSRSGISHYRKHSPKKDIILRISEISHQIPEVTTLETFENLVREHETLISEAIQTQTIQKELFSDYPKTIKSLGAWGGDFILATGNIENREYFRRKGFSTIIPFDEMIFTSN